MNRLLAILTLSMFAVLGSFSIASAHDPGLSSLRIEIADEKLEASIRFATDLLTPAMDLKNALQLRADGVAVERRSWILETLDDNQSELRLEFAQTRGTSLQIVSNLIVSFPPGHKQFVQLVTRDSDVVASRILTEGSARFEAALPNLATRPPKMTAVAATHFFWVGVEHIATGFDHLLFLAALLLASQSFGGAARIITAFTVAHSITLIAAMGGFIEFDPNWVESLIAASIVFAAALNLVGGQAAHRQIGVALGFGLVHGLGFAGLLEQLGLTGEGASLWPLVGFNLGVEAGQLAFALPLLGIIAWLRPRVYFQQRLVPALSILIGAFGLVWLAERTAWL